MNLSRSYLFTVLCLIHSIITFAQTLTPTKNAVKQSVFTQASTTVADASNPLKAITTIKYFDGLGRPLQEVAYKVSPNNKDVILSNTAYDAVGRPNINHLTTPTSNSTGGYVSDVNTLAKNFYNNDNAPFSQVIYEASPLNRVARQYGPGQAWQDANKAVNNSYEIAVENIRKYEVNATKDIVLNGSFASGTLFKLRTTDEQGHQVVEFKDVDGHLILKQIQDNIDTWISTYYVYDNLWRLVAVIQPNAYDLNQTLTANSSNWNEGVFFYVYDNENRLISKKVPSADWEYFVFDKWDRLVWSQDGLQRLTNLWKFYKYDIYNRLIITGIKTDTRNATELQTEANTSTLLRYESVIATSPFYSLTNSYPSSITATDVQALSFFDNYTSWLPAGMSFAATLTNQSNYGNAAGLQTGSAYKNRDTGVWYFTAMYYDNKNRLSKSFEQNIYSKISKKDFRYDFSGNVLEVLTSYVTSTNTTLPQYIKNTYDQANRLTYVAHNAIYDSTTTPAIKLIYDEIGRLTQKKVKLATVTTNQFVQVKVLLSGALSETTSAMRTDLQKNNLIPLNEPYSTLGKRFTHVGGGGSEQTSLQTLAKNANNPNAIVDWVFVELRDAKNPSKVFKTRSALLQADGDVVDVDGESLVDFGVLEDNARYFIAIKHRNHLGVMTAQAVPFINNRASFDFTNCKPEEIYQKPDNDRQGGQQNLTAKGYALWAGDFNADARIIKNGANNDVNHVIATIFSDSLNSRHQLDYVSRGYSTQDVNLDGKVIYQGKNNEVEYINTAILSHPQNTKGLKNHVIEEQLPNTMNATAATMVTLDALQTVDYRYHIRGGLLGINLDASGLPVPNTSQGDLFAYKLEYETAGRWDGNIGKQTWTNLQNVQRNYSFTYDIAKRLTGATYTGASGENYTIPSISYDKNGNIATLQRNGKIGTSSYGLMDNLSYTYAGNRLLRVEDAVAGDNSVDFVNRNSGTDDYEYYSDGSLKKDLNKEITQIDYDPYLKLPKQITLTNNRSIKIIYSANGQVLKRTYSTGEYWEYDGAMVYKNGQPFQTSIPEGRAIYQSSTWTYEYNIKDHLGNVRVSFKNNAGVLQQVEGTNYDPFGIELNGTGTANSVENRFKYQDKESLTLFGLNGINDFGARYYDKTVGRWWGIDPLADMMPDWSPYNYVFNNPVQFIDPFGLSPTTGADGLTNDQWMQTSNPANHGSEAFGGNNITTQYRQENWHNEMQEKSSTFPQGEWDWNASGATEDEVFRIYGANNYVHIFYNSWRGFKKRWIDNIPNTYMGISITDLNIGDLKGGAAFTLPSLGIYLSYDYYNKEQIELRDVLRHEFGHSLQYARYGKTYFLTVGPVSSYSASKSVHGTHKHTWTETEANTLSYKYFNYPNNWNYNRFPIDKEYLKAITEYENKK